MTRWRGVQRSFYASLQYATYATGECGRVGSPKRREIGHGKLAKRALVNTLPSTDDFAYSIRVVVKLLNRMGHLPWLQFAEGV